MQSAQPNDAHGETVDLDTYNALSVGEILRKTREHYGQSINDVAANLNIRANQLSALEQGHLEQIPGRVYAIGFVRSYSEYLGLDGDKMVQIFKAQSVGKRVKPDLKFPVITHEGNEPSIHLIIASLTGLILFIAYLSIFHAPSRQPTTIPPVPEAIKEKTISMFEPARVAAEKATAQAQTLANAPPSADSLSATMELRVSEESWVEITNETGAVVVRQILKPGAVFIVPDDQNLTLATGNAGGLTVYIDGKKIKTLGKKSQVRRGITLKAESFKIN